MKRAVLLALLLSACAPPPPSDWALRPSPSGLAMPAHFEQATVVYTILGKWPNES